VRKSLLIGQCNIAAWAVNVDLFKECPNLSIDFLDWFLGFA
jgi:hypothetical protein